MKMKRSLSMVLVLVLLLSLMPIAAFATITGDYFVNINVNKDGTQFSERDTVLVEFQVKTLNGKTIQNAQGVALAFDATLFDVYNMNSKNVLSLTTSLTIKKAGIHLPIIVGWSADNTQGRLSDDNKIGYMLVQPSLIVDADSGITALDTKNDFMTIAEMRLVLKESKSIDDIASNSVRLITASEAKLLNQNAIAHIDNSTDAAFESGCCVNGVFTNNDTLAAPTFTFAGFTPAIPAYSGTQASAPTVASKNGGAVTLNANAAIEGETVEYAYATTTTAPTAGWQTNVFTNIPVGNYYFFARVAAKGNEHQAGTAVASTDVVEVFAAPTISYGTNTLNGLVIDKAITSMTPTVSGGTGTKSYAVTTGTLPTGLTLNTSSGVISGTPTTYNANSGSVTITVTDGEGVVSAPVTVTFSAVAKKPGELVIAAIDDVTYGGSPVHEAATTNTSNGTVTYTYSKTETGTFEAWKTSNPVGTYWAKGTVPATTTIAEEVSNPVSFKVVQAAITGTVSIEGSTKYGQKLTASSTDIPGTRAYTWHRSGETTAIKSGTEQEYTLVTADVGKTISVKVSDSAGNYKNTIDATTTTAIAKADAPTAAVTGAVSLYHAATAASNLGFSSLKGLPTDIEGAKFSAAKLGTNTENVLTSVAVNTTDATKLDYTPTGTAGAEKTATVTATVTSSNYENISVTITFSTVNISIPWPTDKNGIIVKATPVYGDTYADILTGFTGETVMATAAGANIKGKFSVKDAASYPNAGVTTATLVFTPDAGQSISGTFENAYTITAVAPKPITATVTAATRIYSEANPSFAATVPDGALVGKDTIDGLGLGLTSTANNTSNVGAYDVTGDGAYNANYTVTVVGEKKLTVTPKTLTVGLGDYAVTKVYDGATTAGTASGKLALTEIVKSDEVSVIVGTIGAYADKNAAESKTITLSDLTLDGAKKGNYTLGAVSTFNMTTAKITKKDITAVTAGNYSVTKVYNGTTTAGTASGKLELTGMVSGDDLDINATIGVYDDANVGDAKAVTLTLGALTGTDAGNYNKNLGSSQTTLVLNNAIITPADYTYTVGNAQDVKVGSKLAAITVAPATATGVNSETPAITVTWHTNSATGTAAVDTDISDKTVGQTVTLYWSAVPTDTGNYTTVAKTGSTVFTIVEGDPQIFNTEFVVAVAKTYGDTGDTRTATLTTGSGAITYASTKPNVATVDANTGAVTIVSAGKTTISATAAAVPGTWAKSSTSYKLMVSAREATLKWAGDGSLTYDNQAKNVTATVENKIGNDEVTVTVTGGKEVNAGTHTATASALEGKAAGNYKLTSTLTHDYTIAKADRNLACTTAATLKLAGDKLTGEVGKTTFDDLDKSAVVKYVSTDTAVATVNNGGRVTAVGNGTADINATIAATKNYNAQKDVKVADVTAVTTPITEITSVASSTTGDKLSASISGNTIKLAGFVTTGATITVTPTYATNAALKDGSKTTLVATDEKALKAGGSFTVTAATIDVNYIIDTSAVVLKATNVEMGETDDVTDANEIEEAKKSEVTTALDDAATKAEDLLEAAAKALLECAGKKNEELTEEQKADLGSGYKIKAEVYLKIRATDYASKSSLALEITPWVKYSGVAGTSGTGTGTGIPDLGSALLDNSAIKAPVKISLALPTGFPSEKLFAKHTKSDGTAEILAVTVTTTTGGKHVATWYQSSFSKTELFADSRTGSISYTFEDGTQQSINYTAKDIGTALPNDTKSGNTFNGWNIDGVKDVQKTMTDTLLTAINGGKTATPSFTPAFSGGGDTTSNLTINASAGEGGTITPSGKLAVEKNGSVSFAIKPNEGYSIDTILVDGKAIGKVSSYTFKNVTENHSIAVTFKKGDDFAKFIDVKGHWAESAMRYVFENEIMSGMSQITFEPETELSRAMLVTMLYRIDGKPAVSSKPSFKDVASGMWYTDAIAWAEANKIISGMGDGNFAPNASIQRQQMAAILYRYMQFKGRDVSGSSELTAFTDAKMIGDWALPAMKWAVQEKLISGRTASTLEPLGTAKRAEVAMVMMRWLQK